VAQCPEFISRHGGFQFRCTFFVSVSAESVCTCTSFHILGAMQNFDSIGEGLDAYTENFIALHTRVSDTVFGVRGSSWPIVYQVAGSTTRIFFGGTFLRALWFSERVSGGYGWRRYPTWCVRRIRNTNVAGSVTSAGYIGDLADLLCY